MERQKTEIVLNKVASVSVLTDGSQDVSAIENAIVYLRRAVNGDIHVFFLALVAFSKAEAIGVYNAILHTLDQLPNIDAAETKAKLVAFTSCGKCEPYGREGGHFFDAQGYFHDHNAGELFDPIIWNLLS